MGARLRRAPPYDAGAARAGIANLRKTYDSNLATIANYQQQMADRVDPNGTKTEVVYGETAPYSLVKRAAQYQAEKVSRAARLTRE